MPPTAERLARALAELAVVVDDAAVEVRDVDVPSYPDGPRPSSVVTLTGGGLHGLGEHVGWTTEAHATFARVATNVPCGPHTLAEWCTAMRDITNEPYDRAALEAAVIDLALRQAGTTLFALAAVSPREVRYVVSLGSADDPAPVLATEPTVELKIDVDPDWSDDRVRALATCGRVATIDWKTMGTRQQHDRFAGAFQSALIEDPGAAAGGWHESPGPIA